MRIQIFCFSLLLIIAGIIYAAAVPIPPQTELIPEKKIAVREIARAIIKNRPDAVERIFNDEFVEGLWVYDQPSTAIARALKITEAVQESLKTQFNDTSLQSLKNSAGGQKFTQLIREHLRELEAAQPVREAPKPVAQKKEEPQTLPEDFNLLKGQPDHILKNIAAKLWDADLNRFGKVSRGFHAIADNEFETRPSYLWAKGKIKPATFHAHEGTIKSVFVTNDNKIVSVGKDDHQIRVYRWDGNEYRKIKEIADDINHEIQYTGFSPSTNRLVLSDKDDRLAWDYVGRLINVWNVQTGEKINSFHLGSDNLNPVFSPDGTTIASNVVDEKRVCLTGFIDFWDIATGKSTRIHANCPHEGVVYERFAFSIDGKQLAFVESEGVGIWNLETHKKQHIDYDGSLINKLSFLPDGKLVFCEISSYPPARIAIWDVLAKKAILKFGPDDAINEDAPYLVWSNNGVLLAGVSAHNDQIAIWHIQLKKIIRKINTSENNISDQNYVTSLTFSPDDKMIVAGCRNGDIVTWKVQLPKKKEVKGNE